MYAQMLISSPDDGISKGRDKLTKMLITTMTQLILTRYS